MNFFLYPDLEKYMMSQVKSLVAYFLLLCITVSIIPLNLLHHHEEENLVCDPTNLSKENDLCHQTIYHADSIPDIQCDHHTHIDKDQDQCEFCQLLTTRHYNFLPPGIEWINPAFQSGEKVIFHKSFFSYIPSIALLNRGPPA